MNEAQARATALAGVSASLIGDPAARVDIFDEVCGQPEMAAAALVELADQLVSLLLATSSLCAHYPDAAASLVGVNGPRGSASNLGRSPMTNTSQPNRKETEMTKTIECVVEHEGFDPGCPCAGHQEYGHDCEECGAIVGCFPGCDDETPVWCEECQNEDEDDLIDV